MNLLKEGLYPYIEREMKVVYRDKWLLASVPRIDPDNTLRRKPVDILKKDVMAQLKLMWGKWDEDFQANVRSGRTLPH